MTERSEGTGRLSTRHGEAVTERSEGTGRLSTRHGEAVTTELTAEDVPFFAAGASVLSSGAGGLGFDLLAGWTRGTLAAAGPVRLVDPEELPADALCVAVGVVGSLTALAELLPAGDEVATAVRALERHLGRRVDALVGLNAALVNALLPVVGAALLSLPLVDCDGMGRVFPLARQTSFAVHGIRMEPLAAVGFSGETILVAGDGSRAGEILRGALQAAGGWLMCALYPMSGAEVAAAGITGSFRRAVRAGRILLSANRVAGADSPGRALATALGGTVLGRGRVAEIEHRTRPVWSGHPAGPASVIVHSDGPPRLIRLEIQNEVLLALVDGRLVAAVPDTLSLLDPGTGAVIDVESIALGQRIEVLHLPAAPVWHTPEGLAVAGPRAFGFPIIATGAATRAETGAAIRAATAGGAGRRS